MNDLRTFAETILSKITKTETASGRCYDMGRDEEGRFVGLGLMEQYELAKAYVDSHPADGDELVDEGFLRECGFKLLIFPVFTLGNPLIDVEIHLGKRTAKVGTVEIKFPATRNQLRSLLAALGVNQ